MSAGRALAGAALVSIGALFLLDAAGALDAGEALRRWWPVLLIALGGLHAYNAGRLGGVSGVLITLGLILLAVTNGLFGGGAWGITWPLLLVAAGLWVLVGWGRRRGHQHEAEITGLSVLNAARLVNRSPQFRRATLTSVLGGLRLDLTGAVPDPAGARVSATSVLGTIDIIVPVGWRVEVRGIPLVGGWDDTTSREGLGHDAPRLKVQVLAVLGGVEVKHRTRWA